jgi:RNA polymerase sigma-70 factor (ECF subfamily)
LPSDRSKRFENTMMPHLDAAYNLARWLTGDPNDAEDVAQESSLRALRFMDSFRGGDPRAWLLRIVRNTAYSFIRKRRGEPESTADLPEMTMTSSTAHPEAIALRNLDAEAVRKELEGLPTDFREILILREMEGLAYRKIAEIMDVPIGTVMSRLARARKELRGRLATFMDVEHGCAEEEQP